MTEESIKNRIEQKGEEIEKAHRIEIKGQNFAKERGREKKNKEKR